MKFVCNRNWSPHSHLQKVSCSHNPVIIWSIALSPSPIYRGVRRLPLWSPHPRVQHFQSPIIPTNPPPSLSYSHWPPQLTTPLPLVLSLPLLLPFCLGIALPLSLSILLPVDRSSGKKKKKRLLCLVYTWFYSSAFCVYEPWKGSSGLSCI